MIAPTFRMKGAVGFNMKQGFFDRAAVQKAVDRETRQAMSKAGSHIRTKAIRGGILRRRKTSSKPGKPPNIWSSDPVRSLKRVFFSYDERTKSVVVGPEGFRAKSKQTQVIGNTVPGMLEGGGSIVRKKGAIIRRKKGGRNAAGQFKKDEMTIADKNERIRIMPRPFMGPALKAVQAEGKVLAPWANVVTG